MKTKLILIIIVAGFCVSLSSQEISDDIFTIHYEQKSVPKAVILSALLPGAGQFYVSPKSITAYIFPAIEIGLLFGYFHFTNKGDNKEKDYEYYATGEIIGYEDDDPINGNPIYRYDRDKFNFVKDDLINEIGNSFYDNYFNLDDENTQHFYEDIGKYNKYIFGWADWFDIYATDTEGYWTNPNWRPWFESDQGDKWSGNYPTNPESEHYVGNEEIYDNHSGIYSGMRAKYIKMRNDAEKYYDKAEYFSFGIIFNHIFSALDAVRVTKRYNAEYISNNNFKIKIAPVFVNNDICPALLVSKGF